MGMRNPVLCKQCPKTLRCTGVSQISESYDTTSLHPVLGPYLVSPKTVAEVFLTEKSIARRIMIYLFQFMSLVE